MENMNFLKAAAKNSRGASAFLKGKANVYKLKYFISKNDFWIVHSIRRARAR